MGETLSVESGRVVGMGSRFLSKKVEKIREGVQRMSGDRALINNGIDRSIG